MRPVLTVILALVAALGAGQALGAKPTDGGQLRVSFPAQADGDQSVAIEFSLPGKAAAVDGRLLFDTSAAEIIGLAPAGGGSAFPPQPVDGGVAFGAYDLNAGGNRRTTLRVVVSPLVDGQLEMRLVIDAAADRNGNRLTLGTRSAAGSMRIDGGLRRFAAPAENGRPHPLRAAGRTRDLIADGRLGKADLDVVRAGWEFARLNSLTCGVAVDSNADANGDGCVDIVDVQAVIAAQRQPLAGRPAATRTADDIDTRFTAAADGEFAVPAAALSAPGLTFVVDSTADAADANNGDGLCADTQARCTFRAAITESNWQQGDNRIEFNLAGTAPVRIQYSSSPMSIVQDRTGNLVIDGYSQPGSQVNTAALGSNAIPGVELHGTGDNPRGYGLYITSANNVVRGLVFNNFYTGLMIDTADAHDNRIAGSFFGLNPGGGIHSYRGRSAVALNTGSHHNLVGTPALADRNVARATKAIYYYGPGTTDNVVQNNVLCQNSSGTAAAGCSTGIDHDFGPQNNLDGGSGPNEGNVIGTTSLNGIELSHGWDPAGSDHSRWQVNNNRVIGNWIGFRADGSYNAAFRSAQSNPGGGDNGNGVNVYDGSNFNLIEGNWVASVWDGIQAMSPNATGNIIRGNVIGESPLGEPAPLGRYGIVVRNSTRTHFVEGNTIRNAGVYGIGLIQKDVLWVRLSRNVISDMSGPALFFAVDPDDPTKGADNLIPAPVINTASIFQVSGTGIAGATVEVYRASRSAGQVGLPVEYLSSTTVAANGTWSVGVTLNEGDRATALQIHPSGNTSNLAINVAAGTEPPPDPPSAAFSWNQEPGTFRLDFIDQSTGLPTNWAWDFGDGATSTQQNPTHTYAEAGEYTVSLTAGNAGGTNTTSVTLSVAAPPPSDAIAADSFGRTISNSWGSADIGGPYSVQTNAANYAVGNGLATMALPSAGANRSAQLGVSGRDIDVRFRVAVDKDVSGGNLFIYALTRLISNNAYRPRLILHANGNVSVHATVLSNGSESSLGPAVVVGGLNQQPGEFIWLRAQVVGANPTTIRVKAWADGAGEPSGWQFSVTNSVAALQNPGGLGLRGYASSATNNAPLTLSFDDYLATAADAPPPPPSGVVVEDLFGRSFDSGWGSADVGGTYSLIGPSSNFSVLDGAGSIVVPSSGQSRSATLDSASERDVGIRLRVALDKVAGGGNVFVYTVARRNGSSEYRPRLILRPNGTVDVNASVVANGTESALGPAVTVPGLTQAAGSFIWLRAEVVGADPTTIRVKAWADGSPEPSAWQFTATNTSGALQSAGSLGLRLYTAGNVNNSPLTFTFDDYTVSSQ